MNYRGCCVAQSGKRIRDIALKISEIWRKSAKSIFFLFFTSAPPSGRICHFQIHTRRRIVDTSMLHVYAKLLRVCLRINENITETKMFTFLDSVTTSGQTIFPVKTRHIICYAHGLTLQGTSNRICISSLVARP
jgi:hypothetical protein